MKPSDYWEKRALAREAQARRIANREIVKDILPAYDRAARQITEDVKRIFARYAKDGELTEAEARKLLNVRETEEVLNKLRDDLKEIKDLQLHRKALNRLNAPAYAARISRLEALREQIYAEMAKVSDKEIETASKVISQSYEHTYYRSIFDTQVVTGFAFSFTQLPQQAIKTVLGEAWSGAHYSRRVWRNTQLLAQEAEQVITSGIISGASVPRMAKQIEDVMQTGKYAATRLIRTEANRAYNAAELHSYEETEVEKYAYLATLDSRTCVVCGRLDGKVFPVKEAKEGINYPPMHPNDRCTTVEYFDDLGLEGLKRRARDPKTGTVKIVPADLSWEEWKTGNYTKPKNSGIIQAGRDAMKMDIEIDALTPCLVDTSTGNVVKTTFSKAISSDLKSAKSKDGWLFNWTDPDLAADDIYKLTVAGSEEIQGMIALQYEERDKAVYAHIAESAPWNRGKAKRYEGVGGHLFAIAAQKSMEKGYGGFVFLDAKNADLVRHYEEALGAQFLGIAHPYRMIIDEEAAARLLRIYTFDEE